MSIFLPFSIQATNLELHAHYGLYGVYTTEDL